MGRVVNPIVQEIRYCIPCPFDKTQLLYLQTAFKQTNPNRVMNITTASTACSIAVIQSTIDSKSETKNNNKKTKKKLPDVEETTGVVNGGDYDDYDDDDDDRDETQERSYHRTTILIGLACATVLLVVVIILAIILPRNNNKTTTTSTTTRNNEVGMWKLSSEPINAIEEISETGWFGYDVELSSTSSKYIIIGGIHGDYISVYENSYYQSSSSGWKFHGNVVIGPGSSYFGWSVDISDNGNIIAVGARYGGFVRTYEYDADYSTWVQLGSDIIPEYTPTYYTLQSLSLSSDGMTLAVGGMFFDGGGMVQVYRWNGTEWNQLGQDFKGKRYDEFLGRKVVLSDTGNFVAMGATFSSEDEYLPPFDVDLGNNDTTMMIPYVQVFQWTGQQQHQWEQVGQVLQGNLFSQFGRAIDLREVYSDNNVDIIMDYQNITYETNNNNNNNIEGLILAVGAFNEGVTSSNWDPDNPNPSGKGAVYVFEYRKGIEGNKNIWRLRETIKGTIDEGQFGYDVSLSRGGVTLAVSSYRTSVVDVYYERKWQDGGGWRRFGNPIDVNETRAFALSVSLNNLGDRLAIGIPRPHPGQVKIYDYWSGD